MGVLFQAALNAGVPAASLPAQVSSGNFLDSVSNFLGTDGANNGLFQDKTFLTGAALMGGAAYFGLAGGAADVAQFEAVPGVVATPSSASLSSVLNTGSQILGGVNAIKYVTAKPSASSMPVYGAPVYRVSADGAAVPVSASQAGQKAGAGAVASGAGVSGAAGESTLTKLAAALTVAAIVYQFSRGK